MPVLKSTQTKQVEVIDGFICNYCKQEFTDIWEMQEMFCYTLVGGFMSVWGDGKQFDIVLCQRCAHKLLSDYADEISESVYLKWHE